jgi:group I intron endonuclease
MQKLFHVYLITNNKNSKVYVGKTSGRALNRWNKHLKIAEGKGSYSKYTKYPIHLAISKYGSDNFSFSVLESFSTEDEAYAAEISYIQKFDAIKNGYNIANGGKSGGSGDESNVSIFSKEDILDIFQECINGLSGVEIAKKHDCSKTTIYDILDRVTYCSVNIDNCIVNKVKNIRLQQRKTAPELLDHRLIINDYMNGLSYREIAIKYNSSTFTIQKIVKNNVDQSIINKNKMQPITKEFTDAVVSDYIYSNMTAEQIGNKYQRSKYVIYDILRGKTSLLDEVIKNKIKLISKMKSARKM